MEKITIVKSSKKNGYTIFANAKHKKDYLCKWCKIDKDSDSDSNQLEKSSQCEGNKRDKCEKIFFSRNITSFTEWYNSFVTKLNHKTKLNLNKYLIYKNSNTIKTNFWSIFLPIFISLILGGGLITSLSMSVAKLKESNGSDLYSEQVNIIVCSVLLAIFLISSILLSLWFYLSKKINISNSIKKLCKKLNSDSLKKNNKQFHILACFDDFDANILKDEEFELFIKTILSYENNNIQLQIVINKADLKERNSLAEKVYYWLLNLISNDKKQNKNSEIIKQYDYDKQDKIEFLRKMYFLKIMNSLSKYNFMFCESTIFNTVINSNHDDTDNLKDYFSDSILLLKSFLICKMAFLQHETTMDNIDDIWISFKKSTNEIKTNIFTLIYEIYNYVINYSSSYLNFSEFNLFINEMDAVFEKMNNLNIIQFIHPMQVISLLMIKLFIPSLFNEIKNFFDYKSNTNSIFKKLCFDLTEEYNSKLNVQFFSKNSVFRDISYEIKKNKELLLAFGCFDSIFPNIRVNKQQTILETCKYDNYLDISEYFWIFIDVKNAFKKWDTLIEKSYIKCINNNNSEKEDAITRVITRVINSTNELLGVANFENSNNKTYKNVKFNRFLNNGAFDLYLYNDLIFDEEDSSSIKKCFIFKKIINRIWNETLNLFENSIDCCDDKDEHKNHFEKMKEDIEKLSNELKNINVDLDNKTVWKSKFLFVYENIKRKIEKEKLEKSNELKTEIKFISNKDNIEKLNDENIYDDLFDYYCENNEIRTSSFNNSTNDAISNGLDCSSKNNEIKRNSFNDSELLGYYLYSIALLNYKIFDLLTHINTDKIIFNNSNEYRKTILELTEKFKNDYYSNVIKETLNKNCESLLDNRFYRSIDNLVLSASNNNLQNNIIKIDYDLVYIKMFSVLINNIFSGFYKGSLTNLINEIFDFDLFSLSKDDNYQNKLKNNFSYLYFYYLFTLSYETTKDTFGLLLYLSKKNAINFFGINVDRKVFNFNSHNEICDKQIIEKDLNHRIDELCSLVFKSKKLIKSIENKNNLLTSNNRILYNWIFNNGEKITKSLFKEYINKVDKDFADGFIISMFLSNFFVNEGYSSIFLVDSKFSLLSKEKKNGYKYEMIDLFKNNNSIKKYLKNIVDKLNIKTNNEANKNNENLSTFKLDNFMGVVTKDSLSGDNLFTLNQFVDPSLYGNDSISFNNTFNHKRNLKYLDFCYTRILKKENSKKRG